jgi:hypothetical protein
VYNTVVHVCVCAAPVVFWTHQHGRKVKFLTVWFAFCVPCIKVLEELHHLHHCSSVSRVGGNHRILERHISRSVNAPKWLDCAYILAVLPVPVQM